MMTLRCPKVCRWELEDRTPPRMSNVDKLELRLQSGVLDLRCFKGGGSCL